MKTRIVVGLDVGTTKVCAVAAELSRTGVKILGLGKAPSGGLRKGVVVNMDAAVESIKAAVKEAEASSGLRIRSVAVGITGSHITSDESFGVVGVRKKEVTAADVENAIDAARTVCIPLDREILHVVPSGFVLDGQDGIIDPVGMAGIRLEARVRILTAALSPLRNLTRCCRRAGLVAAETIFQPLASAHAVLTEEEKELGVAVLDIGGGTMDLAVFKEGGLRFTSVISIGGQHVTNDISVGLRVTMQEAERIKRALGEVCPSLMDEGAEIAIHQSGEERRLPGKLLLEVVQPRCDEMAELIHAELIKMPGFETSIRGLVITGGGALLSGFGKTIGKALGLPARTGYPTAMTGLKANAESPLYAAAAGLLTFGWMPQGTQEARSVLFEGLFGKIAGRARDLLLHAHNIQSTIRKEGGRYV